MKTTVFLKSMDSFAAMNEVYGQPEYFGANPPARSTVEVARLPRDVHGRDRSRGARLRSWPIR